MWISYSFFNELRVNLIKNPICDAYSHLIRHEKIAKCCITLKLLRSWREILLSTCLQNHTYVQCGWKFSAHLDITHVRLNLFILKITTLNGNLIVKIPAGFHYYLIIKSVHLAHFFIWLRLLEKNMKRGNKNSSIMSFPLEKPEVWLIIPEKNFWSSFAYEWLNATLRERCVLHV